MRAYNMENQQQISVEALREEGIFYRKLPTTERAYAAPLAAIREERGYVQMDEIHLSPQTPGIEALCDKFFAEHHHEDEEIRFVLAGSGIFDLRDRKDRWMRIHVGPGDLLVVPAGRHHRFTLDEARTITCKRLFRDTSGWAAIPRER